MGLETSGGVIVSEAVGASRNGMSASVMEDVPHLVFGNKMGSESFL